MLWHQGVISRHFVKGTLCAMSLNGCDLFAASPVFLKDRDIMI